MKFHCSGGMEPNKFQAMLSLAILKKRLCLAKDEIDPLLPIPKDLFVAWRGSGANTLVLMITSRDAGGTALKIPDPVWNQQSAKHAERSHGN